MMRRLARSTRTDTLMPYTTLFRSVVGGGHCSSRHLWRHRAPGEGARAKRMGWQGEHIDRIEALVGGQGAGPVRRTASALGFARSEEHTSELQSLMRISYAAFCLTNKTNQRRIP